MPPVPLTNADIALPHFGRIAYNFFRILQPFSTCLKTLEKRYCQRKILSRCLKKISRQDYLQLCQDFFDVFLIPKDLEERYCQRKVLEWFFFRKDRVTGLSSTFSEFFNRFLCAWKLGKKVLSKKDSESLFRKDILTGLSLTFPGLLHCFLGT